MVRVRYYGRYRSSSGKIVKYWEYYTNKGWRLVMADNKTRAINHAKILVTYHNERYPSWKLRFK